jgi:hypothetical protein
MIKDVCDSSALLTSSARAEAQHNIGTVIIEKTTDENVPRFGCDITLSCNHLLGQIGAPAEIVAANTSTYRDVRPVAFAMYRGAHSHLRMFSNFEEARNRPPLFCKLLFDYTIKQNWLTGSIRECVTTYYELVPVV